jgi:hypothetical protein
VIDIIFTGVLQGGFHVVLDIAWATFKRWKIVYKNTTVQHSHLTNEDIEACECKCKREEKRESGW